MYRHSGVWEEVCIWESPQVNYSQEVVKGVSLNRGPGLEDRIQEGKEQRG